MATYCNLANERNVLLAVIHEQAALIDQCPGEERHAIINRCDQIHDQLEQLEQEEDARDKQANLQPPVHIQSFSRCKLDYNFSVENLCLAFSNLVLDEYPEEDDHYAYLCGYDGHDADSDYDDENDSDIDDERCLNCELSERICAKRDCEIFGYCRFFEQLSSVCLCYDDE